MAGGQEIGKGSRTRRQMAEAGLLGAGATLNLNSVPFGSELDPELDSRYGPPKTREID